MRSSDLHWSSSAVQASRLYLLSSCPKGEPSLLHGGIWPWLLKRASSLHCNPPALCFYPWMERETVRVKSVSSFHYRCRLTFLFDAFDTSNLQPLPCVLHKFVHHYCFPHWWEEGNKFFLSIFCSLWAPVCEPGAKLMSCPKAENPNFWGFKKQLSSYASSACWQWNSFQFSGIHLCVPNLFGIWHFLPKRGTHRHAHGVEPVYW